MSVFKFIAEILPGTGWLEPDGFQASNSGITNGRGETAEQSAIGRSKQLDRDVCAILLRRALESR
jgi:hypothetical protein